MQPHKRHIQHIGLAQRVPGIHHAIRAKTNRNTGIAQFGHTGLAAPLWITVVATLQHDIDQWIGDCVHPCLGNQRDQF